MKQQRNIHTEKEVTKLKTITRATTVDEIKTVIKLLSRRVYKYIIYSC